QQSFPVLIQALSGSQQINVPEDNQNFFDGPGLGFALGGMSIVTTLFFKDALPKLTKQKTLTGGMQKIVDLIKNLDSLTPEQARKIREEAANILKNAKSLEDLLPENDPLFLYWARTIGRADHREKLLFNARKAIAISLSQISSGMVPEFFVDLDGTETWKSLSKVFDSNVKAQVFRMFSQMQVTLNAKLRGAFKVARKDGKAYRVDLLDSAKELLRLGVVQDPHGIYLAWTQQYQEHLNGLIKQGKISDEALEYFTDAANYWANTARMGAFDTMTVVREWYNTWLKSEDVTFGGALAGVHTEFFGGRDVRNMHEILVDAVGMGGVRVHGDQVVLPTNAKYLAALSRVLRDEGFADYLNEKSKELRVNERKGPPEYVLQLAEYFDDSTNNHDLKELKSRSIPVAWLEGLESKIASFAYLKAKKTSQADLLDFLKKNFREIDEQDLEYAKLSQRLDDFPDLADKEAWKQKIKLRDKAIEYRKNIAANKEAPPLDPKSYKELQTLIKKGDTTGALNLLQKLKEVCTVDITIHAAYSNLNGAFELDNPKGQVEKGKEGLIEIFKGFFRDKALSKDVVAKLKEAGIDIPEFEKLIVNNASSGAPVQVYLDPKNKDVTVTARPVFPNTLYLEIPFTKFNKGDIFHNVFSLYIQQFSGDSPGTDTEFVAKTAMMNPLGMPGQPRELSQTEDLKQKSLKAADVTDFLIEYNNESTRTEKEEREYAFRLFHPLAFVKCDENGNLNKKGNYRKFVGGSSWSEEGKAELRKKFKYFEETLKKSEFEDVFVKNFKEINQGRIVRAPDCDYFAFAKVIAPSAALGKLYGFDTKDIANFAKNPELYFDNVQLGYNTEFDTGTPFSLLGNGKWGSEL
ncbi:MAG TPA: hypothetical protein V6C96_03685, partial [Vampirovibrionales bacterium]